ncbi:uncharacterized protein CBL_07519 [Carabus blaptoides fortunei]
MTNKKSIPDGWLPVSAIGKPITGTKFLPFKVPLKETLCNNLESNERFSPTILMEKEPNVQLIIDLTNTTRYYDKNEFTRKGVDHAKIYCPGRMVPPAGMMNRFFDVVDKFMKSANVEDKFIGVHCTHGINRTGYFICNYMIQKMGYTPTDAISAFQDARGHKIEREYLIDELLKPDQTPDISLGEREDHTRIVDNNYDDYRSYSTDHIPNERSHPAEYIPSSRPPLFPPPIPPYRPPHMRNMFPPIVPSYASRDPYQPPPEMLPPPVYNSRKRSFDQYSRQSQLNYYDGEEDCGGSRYGNSYNQGSRYRKSNRGTRIPNRARGGTRDD